MKRHILISGALRASRKLAFYLSDLRSAVNEQFGRRRVSL